VLPTPRPIDGYKEPSPFIYGLVDPLDPTHIRYVGLASQPGRPFAHVHESRNQDTYKARWVKKLQAEGRGYSILVLETLPENCSRGLMGYIESCYIEFLREIGHRLTNATEGGDGNINPTQETRAKIAAAKKGQKASEETKALLKIKRAARGPWSDEVKQRMSETRLDYYQDPDNYARLSEIITKSYTPELRAKRSADAKAQHARRRAEKESKS
jgi:hypothetical protein